MANLTIKVESKKQAQVILNKCYDADRNGGFGEDKKAKWFAGSVITANFVKGSSEVSITSNYYDELTLMGICQ
jgi:hypothetical protein